MPVKVILTENVMGLGKIGEEKRVSDGYARNYLFPKKLAVLAESPNKRKAPPASKGLLRQLERKQALYQAQLQAELEAASKLAAEISQQQLTIVARAQEDGSLYGSVGPQQICEALEELGFKLERQQILMPQAIRQIGVYTVDIRLHVEVTASVEVNVVPAEEE
ncbi:MAG: 50S ribosomal protein L9 [Lentisphaerae bacterium]|nr:MAG: 50S ribosomal protein L9 [Lentisphaerota bacterium]